MSSVSAGPAPVRQPSRPARLVALPLALILAAVTFFVLALNASEQFRDDAGRVTITAPRTWSNSTPPNAGQWIPGGRDSGERQVPDLRASDLLLERFVRAIIEPRTADLAARHATEVDNWCTSMSCLDRGQPVAVEVNGRRGLEQVLAHAGAEWTVLLTLESESHLVSLAGHAGDLGTGPHDVNRLRTILRTAVIAR